MFKRNEKGITLIALVITIIVLLILAGVAIAMLNGENGLLTKSVQAKKDNYRGEICDRINTALNACYTEILSDKYGVGKFPDKTQIENANGMGADAKLDHGEWTVTTVTDKSIEIKWNDTNDGYGPELVGTITKGDDGKYTISPAVINGSEASASATTGS